MFIFYNIDNNYLKIINEIFFKIFILCFNNSYFFHILLYHANSALTLFNSVNLNILMKFLRIKLSYASSAFILLKYKHLCIGEIT